MERAIKVLNLSSIKQNVQKWIFKKYLRPQWKKLFEKVKSDFFSILSLPK